MLSLPDLPAELMVQIMCRCPDIKTTLRLSATFRSAYQIWCDNAASVVSTVCSFAREDLEDALGLAKLEASFSLQPFLPPPANGNSSDMVRCNLPSIERTFCCISILREYYAADLVDRTKHDRYWKNMNCCVEPLSDCSKGYIMVRRLAIGYDHQSILPEAYASLHESSDSELDCVYTVAVSIQQQCEAHWGRMGIERHDGELAWWSDEPDFEEYYMPLSWEFAIQAIYAETSFRFSAALDWLKKQTFDSLHLAFGQDLVGRMYGSYKTPWTNLWRKADTDHGLEPESPRNQLSLS